MINKFCIFLLSVLVILNLTSSIRMTLAASNYQQDITFVFYDEDNFPIFKSNSLEDDLAFNTSCDPMDNVTIIVHGWTENCETEWVVNMIENINIFRPGCIVCMNYYNYSKNGNYFQLVRNFDGIADVLTNKLRQFKNQTFDPDNFFLFGFSFGAQLALEAGRRFGPKLISQIDVCEPAGPGFDRNSAYTKLDPKDAAQNVQCIHTSSDKGTSKRDCHQNWNMGNCGKSQVAAGPKPKGSHGLCPYFYNSAFWFKFVAIPRPKNCDVTQRYNETWPEDFRMGYFEDRKSEMDGCDLYANTFKLPPYYAESPETNRV